MRHRTRKSILVLPERLLRRIDRTRGDVERKEFLNTCVDLCTRWEPREIPQRRETRLAKRKLRKFRQDLMSILTDMAFLFVVSSLHPSAETGMAAGPHVVVTEVEVMSKIKTGNTVPVYVTVCNKGSYQQTADVTLSDTSEDVLIGQKTVTLPPGDCQAVHFDWITRGFNLGDHILDASASCW